VNSDDINILFDELSSFNISSQIKKDTPLPVQSLKDEEVNQYVLDKSKAIIEAGVLAVQDMSSYVVNGQNPDEITALAELMNATSRAIETLNKSNLIDRKANRDEKIKKMEIEARKELAQLQPANNVTNNMNVLVASREEIMKKLFSNKAEDLITDDK
jgi:hypothetical protein